MTSPLAPDQLRFIWLHQRYLVIKSAWHFGGSMLRAYTERGHTATISAVGLAALVDKGLCVIVGSAGVRLTEAGRAVT